MIRLFHVSDLHFGCEDQAALDWFADSVRQQRPDAVAVTGDLTMRARSEEFAAAARWLEALDVPLTIEPGNHDLPWNPLTRLLRPYRRFQKIERALERPIDLGPVRIVPLKSTARMQLRLNWSWGVVGRSALDAAVAELAGLAADEIGIVATHHPLLDRAELKSRGRTLRGPRAAARLAEAGARLVLSGHVHDPFDAIAESESGPIRMVGAGTLSHRTRGTPPSFNAITVAGGIIEVELRRLGS